MAGSKWYIPYEAEYRGVYVVQILAYLEEKLVGQRSEILRWARHVELS